MSFLFIFLFFCVDFLGECLEWFIGDLKTMKALTKFYHFQIQFKTSIGNSKMIQLYCHHYSASSYDFKKGILTLAYIYENKMANEENVMDDVDIENACNYGEFIGIFPSEEN